jgi:2-iminobutanoate/2-iminopropanoate deaminase
MPKKKIINSINAPRAVGPYSQAVKAGNMLFVSGQLPLDPGTGQLIGHGIEEQTRCCLKNISEILKESGLGMANVVKTSVFLKNLNDFEIMNTVYGSEFMTDFPARVCVEVARLPRDVLVEIDAIAVFSK